MPPESTDKIELLLLPYDSANGKSLLHRLIQEIEAGSWTRFRAAVAFIRSSGNHEKLLAALVAFASEGKTVELTFGANTFGGEAAGSELDAIAGVLDNLDELPSVRVFLYHEQQRTFHPKIYLFDAEKEGRALLVLGSSNWSYGGLVNNVEANVVIRLDLVDDGDRRLYDRLVECFTRYWTER